MRTLTVWGLCLCVVIPSLAVAQVKATVFVSGLNAPIEFVQDPTQPNVQLVVQQGGVVRVVQNGALLEQSFLDLSQEVSTGGEQGLLGFAFAPDYATSRRFFVNFTNLDGHTVVARFKRSPPIPSRRILRRDSICDGVDRKEADSSSSRSRITTAATSRSAPTATCTSAWATAARAAIPRIARRTRTTLLGKMLRIDVNVLDTRSGRLRRAVRQSVYAVA